MEGKGGSECFITAENGNAHKYQSCVFVPVMKAGNPPDLSGCLPARESSAAPQTLAPAAPHALRGRWDVGLLMSQQPPWAMVQHGGPSWDLRLCQGAHEVGASWKTVRGSRGSILPRTLRHLARDFHKSCFYCDETAPADFSKP